MDFNHSPQARDLHRRLEAFLLHYLLPYNAALHLMDGPDEVHLRTVARRELALVRGRLGESSAYFTTPEQLLAPPRIP